MHTTSLHMYNQELLKDKTIIVTGASSGIGRATAILISQLGGKIVLIGRNTQSLKDTKSKMDGEGHHILEMDLLDYQKIPAKLKEAAADMGPIDGLFHSAGLELVKPLSIIKGKDIDSLFALTTHSFVMFAKGIIHKKVRSQHPLSLVAMSSVAGTIGQSGMSVYSGTKGALDAIARSLAVELAPSQVRVNTLVTGAIETPMHQRLTEILPQESIKDYEDKHLLGFGSAEDVANSAVFLLSDASRWITGTQLVLDGGYTCQ